jgi:hypothetical protein
MQKQIVIGICTIILIRFGDMRPQSDWAQRLIHLSGLRYL